MAEAIFNRRRFAYIFFSRPIPPPTFKKEF
jgi:hypothetical protein